MRSALRLFLCLGVGVALVLPVSLPQASGRDDTRCKGVCRATRTACDLACDQSCLALFPADFEARYACLRSCHATCVTQEDECRQTCAVDRPPTTPENP